MSCSKRYMELMHKYLDHEIMKDEEEELKHHLMECETCQSHFHELKRTETLLESPTHVQAPANFAQQVMKKLPQEKKRVSYKKWLKAHPIFTAAAIFFILMFSSVVSLWNQDEQLTVSKQEGLVIEDDTVIIPEGQTISGDLVVKNGNVKIEGILQGDLVLINGELKNRKALLASAGEVTGQIEEVNQVFEWVWYHIKEVSHDVFSF
ncbi:Transmembrane transcriptional regulator (anti-sigma factor RsiW) [Salinibacillus kushneri]|uniref:Anti-sigma-W factor RsiW n=1 Tax=Salinibacillus kushneri TaxID=237682 RepID=A0A1I0III7_9BACI|nr:zf-HC2 domain-containing protein [Salinibacillus kushneri]SET96808.1 Transmembrane transcriptional regulator (anti-sigma factor RsiW) [Salinibacillus kushneri]